MAGEACLPTRRMILTSGSNVLIRPALPEDIDAIKRLADTHKHELGFLRRPALLEAISRQELLVAQNDLGIIGFVEYRHRKDQQTTLYNVVVHPNHRNHSIGKRLLFALEEEAQQRGKSWVLLKCPIDLSANNFYLHLGYLKVDVEQGKTRNLNVWRKNIQEA
jgi:N-acetylglutamate synthase-like GNAT family acetyltransferase